MALKTDKVAKAQAQETATVSDETVTPAKKTRTHKPPWGRNEDEEYTRDKVLAQVLRGDEASIKTAASVATALLKHPEFAGMELTPEMVAARIKGSRKKWEDRNDALVAKGQDPKPVPVWLALDSARRSRINLSAFEEDTD